MPLNHDRIACHSQTLIRRSHCTQAIVARDPDPPDHHTITEAVPFAACDAWWPRSRPRAPGWTCPCPVLGSRGPLTCLSSVHAPETTPGPRKTARGPLAQERQAPRPEQARVARGVRRPGGQNAGDRIPDSVRKLQNPDIRIPAKPSLVPRQWGYAAQRHDPPGLEGLMHQGCPFAASPALGLHRQSDSDSDLVQGPHFGVSVPFQTGHPGPARSALAF